MDFVTKKTAEIKFDDKNKDFDLSDIATVFIKWQSWIQLPNNCRQEKYKMHIFH